MSSFGERFKALREKRGWTQEDIAEKLGVSRPSIAGYETKNRTPRKELLSKIADLFGVTIDYLLCRTNDPDKVLLDETRHFLDVLDLGDEEAIKKLRGFLVHEGKEIPDPLLKEILNYARYRLEQK